MMDEPHQALRTLVALQMVYMMLAALVGFGCGYMFCKEKYFTKEKPGSESRSRANR